MTKHLFQTPQSRTIGGHAFLVSKVPFEAFDPAVTFGSWLLNTAGGSVELESLQKLKDQPEIKQSLQQLLAACLAVDVDGAGEQLTGQEIGQMPLPMVLEATYVVMEVNLDFFVQTLEASAAAPAEADVDWFAVAQQLIAAGHDRQQIRRYCYAELVGYLQAIADQADRSAQQQAIHTAAALAVS